MNSEIEAIIGSVKKWKEICSGDRILADVVKECPMCAYHRVEGDGCNSCPLHLNGHGCVDNDSTWYEIYDVIDSLGIGYRTLDQIRSKTLIDLCHKQLGYIEECLNQKGIIYEEKND